MSKFIVILNWTSLNVFYLNKEVNTYYEVLNVLKFKLSIN